jgi:hypothetical protein
LWSCLILVKRYWTGTTFTADFPTTDLAKRSESIVLDTDQVQQLTNGNVGVVSRPQTTTGEGERTYQ